MKSRARRITIGAAVLGVVLVAVLVVVKWGTVREAWHVSRLTKVYSENSGGLQSMLSGDARALVEAGSVRALPILIQTDNQRCKRIFVKACKEYGDERVVVGLAKLLLTHDNSNVRHSAAFILYEMGPRARSGLNALRQALADSDLGIRGVVVAAIGGIGPEAKEATPLLVALLSRDSRDPTGRVRTTAAHALGDIDADDPSALSALEAAIDDENRPFRYAAALSLQELGVKIEITEDAIRLE